MAKEKSDFDWEEYIINNFWIFVIIALTLCVLVALFMALVD